MVDKLRISCQGLGRLLDGWMLRVGLVGWLDCWIFRFSDYLIVRLIRFDGLTAGD
ncbi:MAG: hypothetical protein AB8B56_01385 [Crocinitomicaceae bacterium]